MTTSHRTDTTLRDSIFQNNATLGHGMAARHCKGMDALDFGGRLAYTLTRLPAVEDMIPSVQAVSRGVGSVCGVLDRSTESRMTEIHGLRWFAAQLKPNGLHQAERSLTRQGFEIFCPWMIETQRRNGRLQDLRRPLFPGYLFVRLDPEAGLWQAVNATRGLTRLVQTDPRVPTPLPDGLIAGLRARCTEAGQLQTDPDLVPGDRVRVVAGPFMDLVARIETIGSDARIRVLFDLMNRKVVTDLNPALLRRLA